MTRRERLMNILQGKPVDRPPVNFYEISGLNPNPNDPSPFNVYNDPSWKPLLDLSENCSDIIRMAGPASIPAVGGSRSEFFTWKQWEDNGSIFYETTIKIGSKTLKSLSHRDPDIDTTWTLEYFFKDADDVLAFLSLPDDCFLEDYNVENMLDKEQSLGDGGIVQVETEDPLCEAASMFHMQDYVVFAFEEPELFRRLLDKTSLRIYRKT